MANYGSGATQSKVKLVASLYLISHVRSRGPQATKRPLIIIGTG